MKSEDRHLVNLASGDLVEIYSWRKRYEPPKVGVIVNEICEAAVDDFSRYAVLIDDEIMTIRRDMIHKIDHISLTSS